MIPQIEQIDDLWKQWSETREKSTRNALIVAYLPLVQKVVRKMISHWNSVVNQDDLIGMGTLGLIEAIERYDSTLGYEFVTFATWRIRGAIMDSLRELDWVPRSLRKKAKEIEAAYATLEHQLLRSATDEEIAATLGITLQAFHQTLYELSVSPLVSLDRSILHDDLESESTLSDTISDPHSLHPVELLEQFDVQSILRNVIDRLPEKEKLVIQLHYYEEFTFKEISEILELSSSRISQLHTKAIYRLRGALSRRKQEIKN